MIILTLKELATLVDDINNCLVDDNSGLTKADNAFLKVS